MIDDESLGHHGPRDRDRMSAEEALIKRVEQIIGEIERMPSMMSGDRQWMMDIRRKAKAEAADLRALIALAQRPTAAASAPSAVTDEVVERAAQAAWQEYYAASSWAEMPESAKTTWRAVARKVFEAVRPSPLPLLTDELVDRAIDAWFDNDGDYRLFSLEDFAKTFRHNMRSAAKILRGEG